MAKLIIINGPCGVGKSTTARNVQGEIPSSVYADVDQLRRSVKDYRGKPAQSSKAAFVMAQDMTVEALERGQDVVYDKIMYGYTIHDEKTDNLEDLIQAARGVGADVYEFILWTDKETLMKRLDARGWKEGGSLTREKAERFYDQLKEFIPRRTDAKIIDVTEKSENHVCDEIMKYINKVD